MWVIAACLVFACLSYLFGTFVHPPQMVIVYILLLLCELTLFNRTQRSRCSFAIPTVLKVVWLPAIVLLCLPYSGIRTVWPNLSWNLINLLVLGPAFEEMTFRVLPFQTTKTLKFAILIAIGSSLCFVFIHFPFEKNFALHLFQHFIFGLALCLAYLNHRNIMLNISLHSLANFWGLFCL